MKILSPHFSCVVLDSAEFEAAKSLGYPEIYYPSTTGFMKYHKFRGEKSYVAIPVDKIPGVTFVPLKENHLNFLPDGPIPFELFDQVKSFFLSVMEAHKSDVEAMIWILYNKQDGYHLFVPEQVVSKASAKYEWSGIPSGSQVIVDIHSHNTMGAFFSGTDDGDDRIGIRFSGVFGRLNDAEPQTVWRFNYMDKHVPTTIHDIFAPRPGLEYTIPQEWLDKVKVRTYAPFPYQSRGKWTAQGFDLEVQEDEHGFWPYPNFTGKSVAAVANGYYATGYEEDDGVPYYNIFPHLRGCSTEDLHEAINTDVLVGTSTKVNPHRVR